jgi:hypothetical protein
MKCWIDGSECIYQSGDIYGLLNAASNICKRCSHVVDDLENIKEIMEETGIKLEEEELISEEDWTFLTENTEILLSALDLLRKELDKEVSEINEETVQKLIANDKRIIDIRQFIENQKRLFKSIEGEKKLESITETLIREAENRKKEIEEEIRGDAKPIIDKKLEAISELKIFLRNIQE